MNDLNPYPISSGIQWSLAMDARDKKIFDKFEQVKLKKEGERAGSSGLGLTFCKMAVEAHGGKIWAESEGLGKGAVFQTLLPISSQ